MITILLSAVLILVNKVRTLGEFAAYCVLQLIIWIMVKGIFMN